MTGGDTAETWYVRARGRILGPLSWAQLRVLRERGQLARFDQVSRDRQNWVAADSLESLFPRGGGAGGAFISETGARSTGSVRSPEPDPVGFLLLDDEDDRGGVDLAAARPAAGDRSGWYYAEGGTPQGPVTDSDLGRLARDGRIGSGTLYWREGLEQWMKGSDIPELGRHWKHDNAPGPATGTSAPARGDSGTGPSTGMNRRVSPLAIASLAFNLFCGIGNLAAIIIGTLALRQIARSNGTLAGRHHAIAGIAVGILGLLATAIAGFWLVAGASSP